MTKVVGYPFVWHVDQEARPEIDGQKEINDVFDGSGVYHPFFWEVARNGRVLRMGYRYDLSPLLKKVLVKQYGQWQEYYAPNKTKLRKILGGQIDKMIYL